MTNYFGDLDNVVLEDYNDKYPLLFAQEEKSLSCILSDCIKSIDHIGSTAIPGIKSKPVIDIAIVTRQFPIDAEKIKLFYENAYIYWDANPDQNHQFFFKGLPRTHIVHIYPENSQKLKEQILFRDYLSKHRDTAKEYEALKIDLASKFFDDREKYTEMKAGFVNSILNRK